jgi:site-specific DNA recombinase
VDEPLWKRCQDVLNGWHKKPFKYAGKRFTFRGILRCAACGCAVSSDIKKGKYVYLRCTMSKRDCGAVRIREQVLLKQVAKVLKGLEIPQDILEDMKSRLTESQKAKNDFHEHSLKSLRSEYDKVQRQLERLLSMRLDESITKDEYDKKAIELKQRQHELDLKQQQYTQADEDFSITVSYLLNISAQAHSLFERAEPDERRQVLSFVFSNLELDGKKLQYQLKKPFDAVLTASKSQAWLRRPDSNRRQLG